MSETHLVPDFGDHDDDFDDSHQDYLDAERDAEMLPDPTEPPEPEEQQAEPNSGVGWYEFITPTATTEIAYVHENGEVYVPGGGWAPTEPFHLAASRGNVHRLIRADALDVEEMARVIADHGSWNSYSELGVQCSCGADLGAIPLSRPAYDVHQGHQAAMIRAAILGEEAKSDG